MRARRFLTALALAWVAAGGCTTSPGAAPPAASGPASSGSGDVEQRRLGVPATLVVPAIGVSAPVAALGLAADGSQAVSDDVHEVSWWNGGSSPGEPGNAVFAGHTWSQGAGVFDRLARLEDGDAVHVVDVHGRRLTFTVTSVDPDVPADLGRARVARLYRETGRAGLVLITCDDYADGEYHGRVVVRAVPAP